MLESCLHQGTSIESHMTAWPFLCGLLLNRLCKQPSHIPTSILPKLQKPSQAPNSTSTSADPKKRGISCSARPPSAGGRAQRTLTYPRTFSSPRPRRRRRNRGKRMASGCARAQKRCRCKRPRICCALPRGTPCFPSCLFILKDRYHIHLSLKESLEEMTGPSQYCHAVLTCREDAERHAPLPLKRCSCLQTRSTLIACCLCIGTMIVTPSFLDLNLPNYSKVRCLNPVGALARLC